MDDDDLFADLYDGAAPEPESGAAAPAETVTLQPAAAASTTEAIVNEPASEATSAPLAQLDGLEDEDSKPFDPSATEDREEPSYEDRRSRPVQLKDDGKMFIGGLNWETTDQSMKDYFTQFGEVVECTVMRDGSTGRSRGFGFLTFRDPKTVNTVMVKEHILDGKLIDPKRAIPRDEQEKTSKIFVGGVSQDATEKDFKDFFEQFGRVLDATLMMDKDTGRPRGFGFVTFDSDSAVDRTLDGPLEILGKAIEVKRAQPRNNVQGEEDNSRGGGRFGGRGRGNSQNNFGSGSTGNAGMNNANIQQPNQGAAPNNMSQAQMAQWWIQMQQMWKMATQNAAMQNNPAMMQQMMAMNGQQNPAMMQQMAAMYGNNGFQGGMPQSNPGMNGNGQGQFPQEQMAFEQQKYDRQQQARMQGSNHQQGGTWDGMYDGDPAPDGRGRGRGNMRGNMQNQPANVPVNAPTGPKNAGRAGFAGNYRGGGRGGHRGHQHPYARGNGS